ncbi:hypothetical protein Tco_1356658 [Tanacetum coccineum]
MVDRSKLDEDPLGFQLTRLDFEDTAMALTAYADTDHAGCQDTRRSTLGSAQFLGDKLVSWSSKKQKSTSISTTEAEYISMSGCCTQILWIEQVENGVVELYFVTMDYQLADIFTKALPREWFEFLLPRLGMKSMSPKTLKSLQEGVDDYFRLQPAFQSEESMSLERQLFLSTEVDFRKSNSGLVVVENSLYALVCDYEVFITVVCYEIDILDSGLPLDILDSDKMAEENVPAPTRTDEQLVPVKARLPIGKINLLMDLQKKQKNPIFLISVDILQNTNFFSAITVSADVPLLGL